jgi:hypothetical protein
MQTESEMRYTWGKIGSQRTLTQDSTGVRIAEDGKEKTNVTMSLKGMIAVRDGKTIETSFADAPPRLQQVLTASYGEPICTLTVDKEGAEISRKTTTNPLTKSLIVNHGLIESMKLFHPPFADAKKEWDAPASLPAGNGAIQTGTLHYEKVASTGKGQTVRVSGTLNSDVTGAPGAANVRTKTAAIIDGQEIYDTASGEWVSGKLSIKITIAATRPGEPAQTIGGNGTMEATFEKLESKR